MKKIIFLLAVVSMNLSAQAFDWSSLLSQPYQTYPPNQQYQPYPSYQPFVPIQTSQVVNYPSNQTYEQSYNQEYSKSPYQAQYQTQYVNPYQYQVPYGYANNMPYPVTNTSVSNTTGPTGQIVKNIGQSLIYSMMNNRGY